MIAQKGYYVIMTQHSPWGIDSLHFYIDENCFFGRRQRPGLGNIEIKGETKSLDVDSYDFIDFKTGKKKWYLSPRTQNVIMIRNMDLAFWQGIHKSVDSLLTNFNCDTLKDSTSTATGMRKKDAETKKKPLSEMKKAPKDSAYFVSCKEITYSDKVNNFFSYPYIDVPNNVSTKECMISYSNGSKYPVRIATDIKIPSIFRDDNGFPFYMDSEAGSLLLDITFRDDIYRRTILIKEFTIKEEDRQRLFFAEYDAEIIGMIQYILKLYLHKE
jgi:hypothetical protein